MNNVAFDDVLPQLGDKLLVPGTADIGNSLSAESYGRLWYVVRGARIGKQQLGDSPSLCHGGIVGERQVDVAGRRRAEDVRDDFNPLIEMIVDDEGVCKHKDGLRDTEWVGKVARRLGFEIAHAIE